ncbi:MAG: ATP synthase subunit I [Oceanicoccus sp.]|uniref:ATP synthase subunit I n=1 Tax=Oceanicoccus sp. TaxID=2691044 RepID=UPI00262A73DF|nr:ATP synthase subunit I [Oceanicoccus sp.]MDG1772186.1 ATP synthase subunit I [Oceanicoccus sp.]
MQSNKDAATGAQLSKPPLTRLFVLQLLVLLVISAGLYFVDTTAALSALVGGLISIGPNAYFARWAFRFSGARAAGDVARSFYRGEAGKFLSTAVLFAGAFALIQPINPAALFLTYIFMMALNWILALRVIKR